MRGQVHASREPQDMRLQRKLGHLTTLLLAQANSVLVIGCGAGVTAGAVSISPAVEKLTIAEIEPMVPATVSTYFADYNYNVVRNPKTHVVIDDGRHFLLTSKEKSTRSPVIRSTRGSRARRRCIRGSSGRSPRITSTLAAW